VILAETGRPDSALVVILHQHGDDSAVANEKPRYLTRLDSSGNFRFRNLPPGTFYIYALEDQGGNHRYLSEKQLFAFADSPVVVQELNKPILLYAYSEETTPNAPSRTARTPQVKTKNSKNAENRLRLQTNIAGGFLDLLSDLTITSDLPIRNLDTSRIHFSTDSSFTPVANYQITGDTTKKQLNLHCAWKENTRYNLIIEKDFAEDTLGRKLLKTDTISFKTKKISEYGTLRINFHGLDLSVNPVVEFVQSSKVVKAIPLTSSQLDQSIFLPGEYDLRILYDRNKNGKWDPGQFFGKHIQPEVVKPVTRKINIKADWENQFDIQL